MVERISIILILWIFSSFNFAQSVKILGEPKQGSLIFGFAENPKQIKLNNSSIDFSEDGYFVIGFDRDDTSSYILVVEMEGSSLVKTIDLKRNDYMVQKINRMKQKYVSPPKEVEDRIIKERKIVKEAKQKIGNLKKAMYKAGFEKPINKGRVTSIFGSQRILNGVPKNPHNGIDIAVPTGTPVKAMSDGEVILSADDFYYAGNFIILDHGQGLNSMYLHLNESLVKKGQFVKKGEIIGKVGTTGRSTGPHLHWTVQWYDKRVDPNSVFNFFVE